MSELLKSYVHGRFQAGEDGFASLINPTTDEVVAQTSTAGIDMAGALTYARDTGGSALRELSFAQRAELLGKASKALHAHRDELLDLIGKTDTEKNAVVAGLVDRQKGYQDTFDKIKEDVEAFGEEWTTLEALRNDYKKHTLHKIQLKNLGKATQVPIFRLHGREGLITGQD